MDIIERYCRAVRKALEAVSNGADVATETKDLQPLESELLAHVAALRRRPDPFKASQAYSESAAAARLTQRFILSYSGGGAEQVTGWAALAKRVRLSEDTIRVYLSQGRGTFTVERYNPLIEQRDLLTVARVDEKGEVTQSRKMGRPRKYMREEDFGTHLAESARTMPKTRNRRRSEKSESS